MPATSHTPARDQLESCFKKSGQPHLANLVQLTEGDLSNWRPDWNTAAEAALGSVGLLKCFGEIFARLEAGAARAQDQVLARLNAVTADRDSLRTRYENYDEEWSGVQATLAERDATINFWSRK
jgi:adenylosuccinate lyase